MFAPPSLLAWLIARWAADSLKTFQIRHPSYKRDNDFVLSAPRVVQATSSGSGIRVRQRLAFFRLGSN